MESLCETFTSLSSHVRALSFATVVAVALPCGFGVESASAAPGDQETSEEASVGECLTLEPPELGSSTEANSLEARVDAVERAMRCGIVRPPPRASRGPSGDAEDVTDGDGSSPSDYADLQEDLDELEKRVGDQEEDLREVRFARRDEYRMNRGRTQRAFWITWGALTANGIAASLVGFSQYPVVVATTSSANAVLSLLPASFTSFTFGVGSYTLSFVSVGVDIVAAAVPWATVLLFRAAQNSPFLNGGSP